MKKISKIKVIWYCHNCGYEWKGIRFRKQWGRGAKRASRSICPKCGSRMVTPGFGNQSWVKIRRQVWTRDKFQCQCCGIHGKRGGKLVVHHKKPIKEGGSSHINNLIVLCKECHKWEHRMLTWIGSGAKYSYGKSKGIGSYALILMVLGFIIPYLGWFLILPTSIFLMLYSRYVRTAYQKRLNEIELRKTKLAKSKD